MKTKEKPPSKLRLLHDLVIENKWRVPEASVAMVHLVAWYALNDLGENAALEWISLAVNDAMGTCVEAMKEKGRQSAVH